VEVKEKQSGHIQRYIRELSEKGEKSQNTLLSYERDVRQFSSWLAALPLDVTQAAYPDLKAYIAHLKKEGKSSSTLSRNVASLRSFFGYLHRTGAVRTDPSEQLRSPKLFRQGPRAADEKIVQKLLGKPADDSPKGLRDKTMVTLLACTGIRVSEICSLMLSDVDQRKHQLVIREGNLRTVPYNKDCARLLSRYLKTAREKLLAGGDPGEQHLFLNCSGKMMSRQGFWKVLKKYGRDAGVQEELSPHMLRHSYAVRSLKEGDDLRVLQKKMGHSSVSTTQEYLYI